MDNPTIKQIIITWSDSYNNRIPIPKEQRRAAYLELLKTFIDYGYRKCDVSVSVFNEIIKETVPEHYKPLQKKITWTRAAERDLSSAMEQAFPSVKLAKLTEEDLAVKVKEKLDFAVAQDEPQKVRETIKVDESMKPQVEFDNSVFDDLGFD